MGRHAEGWTIRQRAPGHAYAVRFTHNGTEYERSTGTSDDREASLEAARIYADIVRREPAKRSRRASTDSLEELIGKWLVDISATHDPETVETWTVYGRKFVVHFAAAHHLTPGMAEQYMLARLRLVLAETVRKELSALRSLFRWMKLEPAGVPSVPKRATGTKHGQKRRSAAVELSPRESLKIIAALPAWSTSKKVKRFPIRARFLVGYQTSLRPSTLDALSVPEHYRKGQGYIRLTPELDKNRWNRVVPLTREARKALDAVCPASGLIFGKHDYRDHVGTAGAASLPPDRAERFTGAHLRSARITHLLEATGNLPGVQYLAGHKMATTTNRYAKPSLRAAEDVLRTSERANGKNRRRPKAASKG